MILAVDIAQEPVPAIVACFSIYLIFALEADRNIIFFFLPVWFEQLTDSFTLAKANLAILLAVPVHIDHASVDYWLYRRSVLSSAAYHKVYHYHLDNNCAYE